MHKLAPFPVYLFCLMLFCLMAALSACSNPNYCADHRNNDCRLDIVTVSECTASEECSKTDGKNVCELETFTCVQCTAKEAQECKGATPACRANVCTKCEQHAECADSATCLPDGQCAAQADVAYVSAAGTNNTQCTKEMPCDKIDRALMRGRLYVKVSGQISEALILDSRNATIFADPQAKLTRMAMGHVVEIKGTSDVAIYDLEISGATGNNAAGIKLEGSAKALLARVKLTGNEGYGVAATDGSLTLTRSIISGNHGGGVLIDNNDSFNITNNFIYRNGNIISSDFGGVKLSLAAPGANRFDFNTVSDNHAKSGLLSVGGLLCDTLGFNAANNIVTRNDVAGNVSAPNANLAGSCTNTPSIIGSDITPLKFKSPDTSPYDYHLNPGSSALGMATNAAPQADEQDVDFDGEKRPAAGRDLGADELL